MLFEQRKNFTFIRFLLFSLVVLPSHGLSEERRIAFNETKVSSRYIRDPRIVNGRPVRHNQVYPYFARIRMKNYPNTLHCGGSLIGPDVVLCAAHCFRPPEYFIVGVGAFTHRAGGSEIEREVSKIVIHKDYDHLTFYGDIMLVFLKEPVYDVTPVELNDDTDLPEPNTDVVAVGLGSVHPEVYMPATSLQEVTLGVLESSFCNRGDRYNGRVNDRVMFCAGYQNHRDGQRRDSCFGDSGGPVTDITQKQVGIVSWGVGCTEEKFPGVYVKVAEFYSWIEYTACLYSQATSGGHFYCHKTKDQSQTKVAARSRGRSFRRKRLDSNDDAHNTRRKQLRSREDDSTGNQNEDFARCDNARGRMVEYFVEDGSETVYKQVHATECRILEKAACYKDDLITQEPIWQICSLRCKFLSHCTPSRPEETHDQQAHHARIAARTSRQDYNLRKPN
mmetsp:Transcript_3649/g.5263  ORF Transcript_3649/g.5263 Transcript_3649/m.5263 type:complete len:448 (-) Transcript_3649:202-1545(-)